MNDIIDENNSYSPNSRSAPTSRVSLRDKTEALRVFLTGRQTGGFVSSFDMGKKIKKMAAQKTKEIYS